MDKLLIKSRIFPAYLGLFHVSVIVLIGVFGSYKVNEPESKTMSHSSIRNVIQYASNVSKKQKKHITNTLKKLKQKWNIIGTPL
jgi:hypothetical protein